MPPFPAPTGTTYIGSVKVKLGPIQLTYQGKARIVEADESAHRAVIEASGSASRSASTASMTVTATATALDDDHTAVNMATSLTITGRPAQFGRGVMVEVGNKILGQFADCLSGKLAASVAPRRRRRRRRRGLPLPLPRTRTRPRPLRARTPGLVPTAIRLPAI